MRAVVTGLLHVAAFALIAYGAGFCAAAGVYVALWAANFERSEF